LILFLDAFLPSSSAKSEVRREVFHFPPLRPPPNRAAPLAFMVFPFPSTSRGTCFPLLRIFLCVAQHVILFNTPASSAFSECHNLTVLSQIVSPQNCAILGPRPGFMSHLSMPDVHLPSPRWPLSGTPNQLFFQSNPPFLLSRSLVDPGNNLSFLADDLNVPRFLLFFNF